MKNHEAGSYLRMRLYNHENFMYFCLMERTGYIEIMIKGLKGNLELTPDNYDIRELLGVLEQTENLLFPGEKKDRPVISYSQKPGSVRHFFQTGMQTIIGFTAVLSQISSFQNIDFLELNTARAIEAFQDSAIRKDYIICIKTSLPGSTELKIDKTTKYYRTSTVWADAEFYFYGKVTNAGGKDRVNIHIMTDDLGIIRIETPQPVLENLEGNILYKSFGVRASGKQNTETGEIDRGSLVFIEMIDYSPKYDDDYLQKIRGKAKTWLRSINPDDWLRELRGEYNA